MEQMERKGENGRPNSTTGITALNISEADAPI